MAGEMTQLLKIDRKDSIATDLISNPGVDGAALLDDLDGETLACLNV